MASLTSGNNSQIDPSFIEALKERVNIVDLIDSSVPLKKSGKHFECCCPFHQEKTPSFKVTEATQMFHCFGCGEGGDSVDWLQMHEGLTFFEAVNALAKFAGVEVPKNNTQSSEQRKAASAAYNLGSSLRQILRDGAKARNDIPLSQELQSLMMVGAAENPRLVNGMLKKYQEQIDVTPLRQNREQQKPGIAHTEGFSIPLTTKSGAVTGFVFYDNKLQSTPLPLNSQYDPKEQWVNIHNVDREKPALVLFDMISLYCLDKKNSIDTIQFMLEPSSRTQLSERQMNSAQRACEEPIFVLPNTRYRASAVLYALVNHSDIEQPLRVVPFSALDNISDAEPQYLYDFLFEYWDHLDERVKPKMESLLEIKGLQEIKSIYVDSELNSSSSVNQMGR